MGSREGGCTKNGKKSGIVRSVANNTKNGTEHSVENSAESGTGRSARRRSENSRRYHLLDTLRGISFVNMVAYHAVWDLVYLYGFRWGWYKSNIGFVWQQYICWSFILLSGFCQPLGHKGLRRALQVFCSGALVTAVTVIFLPDERILFGVLTFLGSAMLLLILFQSCFKKCRKRLSSAGKAWRKQQTAGSGETIREQAASGAGETIWEQAPHRAGETIRKQEPVGTKKADHECSAVESNTDPARAAAAASRPAVGLVCSAVLFVLTRNVNEGTLGFAGWNWQKLPAAWYRNLGTAYLGFPPGGFYSADYFSLLPWFFLFLCGFFLYHLLEKQQKLEFLKRGGCRPLEWIGRHTLLLYLLHQPVIWLVLRFLLG